MRDGLYLCTFVIMFWIHVVYFRYYFVYDYVLVMGSACRFHVIVALFW